MLLINMKTSEISANPNDRHTHIYIYIYIIYIYIYYAIKVLVIDVASKWVAKHVYAHSLPFIPVWGPRAGIIYIYIYI